MTKIRLKLDKLDIKILHVLDIDLWIKEPTLLRYIETAKLTIKSADVQENY